MLNLYDTATNPGATVVKLLTGKRPLVASTHSRSCRTESSLLHLVEPADELAANSMDEYRPEHELNVA